MVVTMLLRCSILALILFLLTPLCVFAETPARVGILVQKMGRAQSQAIKGLTAELKRLGYENRKNIILETANVKGNRGALASAAAALTSQKLNLIFTTGTSATRAATTATTEIPVVFVHPADPVAAGLFKSAKDRAKNLTGVAAYAGETMGTRLAFFKEILPELRKIIIFFDATNGASRESFKKAENAAKTQGIAVAAYPIKSANELETTIANLRAENGVGIFQVADNLVDDEADFLFEKARVKKIPTMFNEESWAINGALAAYGPDYFEMGRKAAGLAAKIIGGARADALPVERASKFDLTLNYRTSSFIGIRFSAELLKKANKIIR